MTPTWSGRAIARLSDLLSDPAASPGAVAEALDPLLPALTSGVLQGPSLVALFRAGHVCDDRIFDRIMPIVTGSLARGTAGGDLVTQSLLGGALEVLDAFHVLLDPDEASPPLPVPALAVRALALASHYPFAQYTLVGDIRSVLAERRAEPTTARMRERLAEAMLGATADDWVAYLAHASASCRDLAAAAIAHPRAAVAPASSRAAASVKTDDAMRGASPSRGRR